jgi:translocation and assembly module TamA
MRIKVCNFIPVLWAILFIFALTFLPQANAQLLPFLKAHQYEVIFQGVEKNKSLRKWLKEVSRLKNKEEQSLSITQLRLLAEDDLPALLKALHAQGYYSARINVDLNENAKPIQVIYHVEPGLPYHVISEQITLVPPTPEDIKLPNLNKITPAIGKQADAGILLDGAKTIQQYISDNNCLLKVNVNPALKLDAANNTADAFFEVSAGPKANFGEIFIKGNESIKDKAILGFVPWKKGECFHALAVNQVETDLLKTRLFATVDVTAGDTKDEQGEVPVTITVKERFSRTIKAGISYMTDQGVGTNVGWEHRNLFGGGEKLEVLGIISELEYSAETNFTKPYFFRKDQSLKLGARIAHEEPDAYTSDNISVTSLVERELTDNLKIGAGVGYRLAQVDDIITGQENFGLVFLPIYGAYDNRDDILNPKKGINARIDGTPYFDTLGTDAGFFRSLASGSTYFKLPGYYEPVLAVRGALGSIVGSSTGDIPADVRFYAGGGSSVRGYAYQALSPRIRDKPIGGKSLLEVSTELRLRFTDTIGGAVFLDGGSAFESEYPDFQEKLRWGTGVGIRYYSGFGPLRLDVAVPLDRLSGESSFQLYVSLGQAF